MACGVLDGGRWKNMICMGPQQQVGRGTDVAEYSARSLRRPMASLQDRRVLITCSGNRGGMA